MHSALFQLMRGDRVRAAQNAHEVARLARENDLPMWRALGVFLEGWVKSESGALLAGLEEMRRGAEFLSEQNVLIFDGLLNIMLAESEARAGNLARAIVILDQALAMSGRMGHPPFDAEVHRARGDILLKRDPSNPAPAEKAYKTAIAIAGEQGARSYVLLAALPLARLLQSNNRPIEAHEVLEPALEGFSATPEFPAIAEAQALLATLQG
jgi:predicted ATPase